MVASKDEVLKKVASARAYIKKESAAVSESSEEKLYAWEKTVEWIFVRKYYKPKMFAAPLDDLAEGAGDVLINFSDVKKWSVIEFKSDETKISVERGKFPIYCWSKWVAKAKAGRSFAEAIIAFNKLVAYWRLNEKPPHLIVFGEKKEEFLFTQAKKMIQQLRRNDSTKAEAEEWALKLGSHEKSASIEIVGRSYWGEWCNQGDLVKGVPPATDVNLSNLKEHGWELEKFKTYVSTLLSAKALGDGDDGGSGGSADEWLFSSVMGMTEDGKCISFSLYEFALQFGLIPPPPQNTPPVTPPTAPPPTPSGTASVKGASYGSSFGA